ncbi:MAG TPA: hypothetical protein VG095_00360 [Chthoniobacterales bacterium]|nr:hypothetical protein [Chthoniobacterales bacterium]
MRFKPAKHSFLIAALLGFSAASSFANAVLVSVDATPYDRQMTPIRPVLTAGGSAGDRISMLVVNEWMADLRDIPYGYHLVWKTPAEVESRGPADCKGKAVALYHRMKANGATDVRLVIGKRAPTSRITHAWLEWETANGTYMLDPTFNYSATRTEKIPKGSYVPHYAYAGAKKFRAATNLVAQN